MALSGLTLQGFLRAICRKAEAEGVTIIDVLAGISDGKWGVVMSGGGSFDITSTSSAGHSVTLDPSTGPKSQDITDAVELLWQKAEACELENPGIEGKAWCTCVAGKLPKGIKSFRSTYVGMGYTNA